MYRTLEICLTVLFVCVGACSCRNVKAKLYESTTKGPRRYIDRSILGPGQRG